MENKELYEEMVAWLKEHHSEEELTPPKDFTKGLRMWYYDVALDDKNLPKKFKRLVIDGIAESLSDRFNRKPNWDDDYITVEVPNSGLFGNPVEYRQVRRDAYEALFQNCTEMGDN